MFDLEASYKLAEEAKEGDEKRLENGKKLADLCVKGKPVIYDNIHSSIDSNGAFGIY